MLGKGRPGEARTAVAARPAMAVTVAGDGAGRARGELGGRQQGAVPRKPGARERFWAEARRVGGQVASAPAYGAAVGEVQGDGGGRNGQWQFRN